MVPAISRRPTYSFSITLTSIEPSPFSQAVAAAKKAKRELTADEKALVARVVSAANILVQASHAHSAPHH